MATWRKVTVLETGPAGSLPLGVTSEMVAVTAGDLVFTSGIAGLDPASGALGATPERQFELAFRNLEALLLKAGLTAGQVGLVTVYIPGPDYRQYINGPWLRVFSDEANRPARKTDHVNLPDGVFVELQVNAVRGAEREQIQIPGLSHRDPIPNGCRIGDLVFSSVMVAQDAATGLPVTGKMEQLDRSFANCRLLMEAAGGNLDNVAHMLVFLSDFAYQPNMVDAWLKTWPEDGNRPARKTLRYPLGGDSLIQAQITGVLNGTRTNYEIPGVGHHDPIPMAAKVGNVLFSSGISGSDPANGGATVEGLEAQIRLCQSGMTVLMEQAGGALDDIALVTVLIQDFASVPVIRRYFDELFPDESDRPALKFIDWRMPQGISQVQYHLVAVLAGA